jgi:hypothetical protein
METFAAWRLWLWKNYSKKKLFLKELLTADKEFKFVESDFALIDNITVRKWKDHYSNSVLTASNMHNPQKKNICVKKKQRRKQG